MVEEARELYNGEPAKLRSEQVNDTSTTATGPQGPPGATSNSPASRRHRPQAHRAPRCCQRPGHRSGRADRKFQERHP